MTRRGRYYQKSVLLILRIFVSMRICKLKLAIRFTCVLQLYILANSTEIHRERFDFGAEYFNRFWKPEQLPNYQNIFKGIHNDGGSMAENYPPYKVLNYAIRAQNVSDSIFLPIDFHETTQLWAYFVFYFYDVSPLPVLNNMTKLTVYIDGIEKNTTTVRPYEECVVVSVYPIKVTGTANVTISPAAGTTLPPILNAMEVFTTIEVATSMANPLLSSCAFFYMLVYLSGFVAWFG